MAHDQHFFLFSRQKVDQLTQVAVSLFAYHFIFGTFIIEFKYFENIKAINGSNYRCPFFFAEMVYYQVMCNSYYTWKKFTFFVILSGLKCIDYLNKSVLKNIFCEIRILY